MNSSNQSEEMKRREFLGVAAATAALVGVEATPCAGQEPKAAADAQVNAAQLYKRHAPNRRGHDRALPDLTQFDGMKAQKAESCSCLRRITRRRFAGSRNSAWIRSIRSRTRPSSVASSAASLPHWSGINTFLKVPYLEDVRKVGEYDVAFVGVPFDIGCTFRTGTRFGPQGIRRISSLYHDIQLRARRWICSESLKMCDVGDIFCPANITKSHDQITKGVAHILSHGTLPMIMGGDHSIGYPCARGVAQCVEGKVGIIHLDRHVDTQEKDMDEIMHTCPWFHATNIPNCPPTNLVQLGIGGWQVPRPGCEEGPRARYDDPDRQRHRAASGSTRPSRSRWRWRGRGPAPSTLSFDIDSVDAGFVPGTGWPEPGGFLPREALAILRGDCQGGDRRHGGRRGVAAVRHLRHHRPAGRPCHGGCAGRDGQERPHRRPAESLIG